MGLSLAERVAEMTPAAQTKLLAAMTDAQIEDLLFDWYFWARPEQLIPEGDDWFIWLMMTGRSWGKTRSGGEAIREWDNEGICRFHLVGRTAGDVRDVMIEGESGMLSLYPENERPLYEPSKRRLTLHSGAVCELFSADEPDQLRGPQAQKAWIDEPASWRRGTETFDNLLLGLRLGPNPQIVATTTPRPVKLLRTILADPGTVLTTGSLLDNVDNLAPAYAQRIINRYAGSRLGHQEIEGVLLSDAPGALWKRTWIDNHRWTWEQWGEAEKRKVVVAVDPSGSDSEDADEAGIVVAAEIGGGEYAVVADKSGRMRPRQWARAAIDLYVDFKADYIVAEKNYGGAMVEETIQNEAVAMEVAVPPIKLISAKRGKVLRAQPVATLYDQSRVHHVGIYPELEDQQCNFDPLNMPDNDDRVDAVVYALMELSGVVPLGDKLMS